MGCRQRMRLLVFRTMPCCLIWACLAGKGLEVLRNLRKRGKTLPVMILTARDTVEDRVRGLDAGADDYLLKPFALDELLARLRALLRRAHGLADTRIRMGRLDFDSVKRQASVDGALLILSAREVEVLEILLNHGGRVTAKEAITDRLTGWGDGVGDNAVEVYIHRLRRKLERLWCVDPHAAWPGICTGS